MAELGIGLARLVLRRGGAKFVLCGLLILMVGAAMASAFSGRQPVTVGLDVGISIIRLVLPFLIVLVVQELLAREFECRYFLVSISYPVSRVNFLLMRFGVSASVVLASLLILSAALAILVHWLGKGYQQSTPVLMGFEYLKVVGAIYIESLVLTALSVLLAVWSRTPGFVMIGTLGFALIARSYVYVLSLVGSDTALVSNSEEYRMGMSLLRYMIPDLGGLDIRENVLYGRREVLSSDFYVNIAACVFYAILLLLIAVGVLQRKRFS